MSQLNVSTRLISVKPDTLEYIYSTGKSKRVPVKMQGKVTAARQYYLSDTIYSPDSVLVYAPVAILDTITTAYTRKVDLSNIADTLTHHVALPSKVQITFQVGYHNFYKIEANSFIINISYEELLKLGSDKYTVKLKSIPDGVSHIRIAPKKVDFLIEQVSSNGD